MSEDRGRHTILTSGRSGVRIPVTIVIHCRDGTSITFLSLELLETELPEPDKGHTQYIIINELWKEKKRRRRKNLDSSPRLSDW